MALWIDIILALFVVLPAGVFMYTQLLRPAWRGKPLLPMFNSRSPEQLLEAAKLEVEQAKMKLALLEEQDKANRLTLQIDERQRALSRQLIRDAEDGNLDSGLLSLEDGNKRKREETR
jgi:hypothetical protein